LIRVAFHSRGLGQRSRCDVLGHAVDPVGEAAEVRIVAELGPDGREALVGLASEHHRVRQQELFERGVGAVVVQYQPLVWSG
jgi:hypothetical protein